MNPWTLAILAFVLPGAAIADTVVAARTIRAKAVITASDLSIIQDDIPGTLQDFAPAIGQEARQTIFAGRPLSPGDLAPPAAVERNALVEMIFEQNGLVITAEGRALGRGATGSRVRVMNLASRMTITGTVIGPGRIMVP